MFLIDPCTVTRIFGTACIDNKLCMVIINYSKAMYDKYKLHKVKNDVHFIVETVLGINNFLCMLYFLIIA